MQGRLPGPVSFVERPVIYPCRVPVLATVRTRGFFLVFIIVVAAFSGFHNIDISTSATVPDDLIPFLQGLPPSEGGSRPPRFYEWHEREKRLPQHDLELPYPQGREGRYIRFSNQLFGMFSQPRTPAT